jgi:NAD(P)H dehydrogenase (quinone)
MPTYAVTGAAGHLGRLAVEELLARGVPSSDVIAVVRSASKAADLAERGVQVREADYSHLKDLEAALAGVDRLLLISSSEAGRRVAHHTNVIEAARTVGTSRIVYTSMINLDDTTSPLADEHQESERVLREAGVPFTLLRNGWYTENYTDQLDRFLQTGEIVGAAVGGRISAATRQDLAAAAVSALQEGEEGNRTYELGGPAFDLSELAQVISEVTGTPMTYRDLPADDYATWLLHSGLDEQSARFVAALDVSIAQGDLETDSQDLTRLLGRPATSLTEVVRAARGSDLGRDRRRTTIGFIGAGNLGSTLAGLAVDAGYDVVLSNSRGPETLTDLTERLGSHARAATPFEAAAAGDIVVVTVPLRAYLQVPVGPLAGKVVIDTNNYYPNRDGHITELDDESTTTSELLEAHLPTSHVVKAFNNIFYKHLATLSRPRGAADRSAMAIAGDDEAAKKTVTAFLDAIGYDAHDTGSLSEGWRYQRDTTAYAYSADGSFDHPEPADAERLTSLLAQAKRYRDM